MSESPRELSLRLNRESARKRRAKNPGYDRELRRKKLSKETGTDYEIRPYVKNIPFDSGIYTQKCKVCEEVKDIHEFQKLRLKYGNLVHYKTCKTCSADKMKTYNVDKDAQRRAKSKHKKIKNSTKAGWCQNSLARTKVKCAKKDIPFNLSIEDISSVFPDDWICPAHGTKMLVDKVNDNNPSLDRINPSLGYVKGNIAVICLLANKIKHTANSLQIFAVAEWLKKQEDKNASK